MSFIQYSYCALLQAHMSYFFLYNSLSQKNTAVIIASLFALYPTNIIYAHYMLTEILSQTVISVLIYLGLRWIKDKKTDTISKIFLLSSIAALLKYSFIIYAGLSGLILFVKRPITLRTLQYVAVGTLIVGIWIGVNHRITGIWGISDNRGAIFIINLSGLAKHFRQIVHLRYNSSVNTSQSL